MDPDAKSELRGNDVSGMARFAFIPDAYCSYMFDDIFLQVE
jgi:hypothetical protein